MTSFIKRLIFFTVIFFFISSCSSSGEAIVQEEPDEVPVQNGDIPNILFVIADDMGLDATRYSPARSRPH